MNLLRILVVSCLALFGQSAHAIYFYYTPAATSVLPINGVEMPVIEVNAACCDYIDATFHVTTTVTTGVGGSAHSIYTDATLTTNSAGEVVAWTLVGRDTVRPRVLDYGSSYQAGAFSEWLQLSRGFVPSNWVDEGPVFFTAPGTWSSSLSPVPEPSGALLAAVGLGALFAARRLGRKRG